MTIEELKSLVAGEMVATITTNRETNDRIYKWKVVGAPRVYQRAGKERVEVTIVNTNKRVNWINHTNCDKFKRIEGNEEDDNTRSEGASAWGYSLRGDA